MTVAIESERLGRRFARGAWALHDCSFEIPTGSVVGLVGSNGAGKTTLLTILAGQLQPSAGLARVGGVDPRLPVGQRTVHDRTRLVNQQRPLYGSLSALQMLEFGRRTNRFWDDRLARGWLDAFDVPLSRACRRLSGGQRTQVTLALAIGARPAVLLLDEPLAELDPAVRADVTGALLSLAAERGMTIMLSTHAITELQGVVDHVVLLDAASLLLAGDVDDLLATHMSCTGPADEAIPYPGTPVHLTRTARQTTAMLRVADSTPSSHIEPAGWRTEAVALEQIVLAYLRAAAPADRMVRLHSALDSEDAA